MPSLQGHAAALLLTLPLAASAAPIGGPAAGAQDDGVAPWLELPDQPLGRLWASVGPRTEPWARMRDVRAVPPDAEGEPWASWAAALRALEEPAGEGADAPREARMLLVRLAAEDERPDDAYAWVRSFGADDPRALAGSLPYLFPGVPLDHRLGPRGKPAPMAEGVVLRPVVPPATDEDGARLPWCEAVARGLRIGETTFDMKLKLDGSGVVVQFEEVVGPPVKAKVVLPRLPGARLKSLYVDWELAELPEGADAGTHDWSGTPVEVVIQPSELASSVFGRVAGVPGRLPASPAGALPSALRESGIELVVPGAAPGARWEAIGAAIAAAAGVEVEVIGAVEAASRVGAEAPPAPSPTRIDLAGSGDPERLRRALMGAVEARYR